MTARIKSSEWSDFSERLVRIHGLPAESEFRLYRKSDERRVRSDLTIKRRAINRNNVVELAPNARVSEMIANAKNLLSTDIDARGFEMRFYDQDGSRINGNTLVSTVRCNDPANKDDPVEAFMDVLEECNLDDLTLRQVGALYKRLSEVIGKSHFEERLVKFMKKS